MSQASAILAAGHAVLAGEFPSIIRKDGRQARCVSTEITKLKGQLDAGTELDFDCLIEMPRDDFEELGITFHDTVQVDDDTFEVRMIRPDKTDPCIRIGLRNIKGQP